VWVTEADQSVVLVTGPVNVIGDTLVGYVAGKYEEMPSSSLKQIVVQSPASTRTALLVAAIGVGIGGFVYAIAGSGSSSMVNPISGDCDKHPELCGN
jgi:Kef-type K+ transport system membrane component KefB